MDETKAPLASIESADLERIRSDIKDTRCWLKFLGILFIIDGALDALTVVGIVIAWLPIWIGVILLKADSRAADYAEKASAADLVEYHARLKGYFTLCGIFAIVLLAFVGILLIGGIVALLTGLFPCPWDLLGRICG